METATTCNTASLSPYTPTSDNPWDEKKAQHLYRRLSFGTTPATINMALAGTPQAAVDTILNEALAMPNTPAPTWGYWSYNDHNPDTFDEDNQQNIQDWYRQAATDIRTKGLKSRLTFFWLNHFVTQLETYFYAPYQFQYWDLLQTHALGNFREFTRAMGTTPAMLLFLNGFENTNQNPNENYARELYELFTLGENNGYTQQDIEETSRALTGYNHWNEYGGEIYFDSSTFDSGAKTIFGTTANFDYDGVIDHLFNERAALIAPYICRKLYTYFVSPAVNEVIVEDLAATFLANDFEIAPVLEQLFKSEHFFAPEAIGVVIKSPYDLTSQHFNELNFTYDDEDSSVTDTTIYINQVLGQDLFQPVDVAGWQRDQEWINSSTITGRWIFIEWILWPMWNADEEQFREWARDLTGNSNDPSFITRTIVDHMLSKPLNTESDYDIATTAFRWEVPENYYDDGTWDLNWGSAAWQVVVLLRHIFKMPEFQFK